MDPSRPGARPARARRAEEAKPDPAGPQPLHDLAEDALVEQVEMPAVADVDMAGNAEPRVEGGP
eukprot:6316034-Lingulodinium_polyedra.AAC.1